MSHSERDDDLRRLRELKNAMNALIPVPCSIAEDQGIRQTPSYRMLEVEFDRIFGKYGFNPSIFKDSERAGSKRNAAKQIKQSAKRRELRAVVRSVRSILISIRWMTSDNFFKQIIFLAEYKNGPKRPVFIA